MRLLFTSVVLLCILICQKAISQQSDFLVGYWSFDAIDGKMVKDQSGNGNDGNINGDVKVVNGKSGKALEFAPGAYVEIPDSKSLKDMKEYTIGMWVNMNNLSADWNHLFEKDGSYGITINSTSRDFRYTPNSSKVWLESKFKVETGAWYYVTMVATDSAISFYVNGEKKKVRLKNQ